MTHSSTQNMLIESGKSVSLRERVYTYLCASMAQGRIRHGEFLDQDAICRELNISKSPLRDALIRLEAEGFVTIIPRKGVLIPPMTQEFIKSAYHTIGALESACLLEVFEKLTPEHIATLEKCNAKQSSALEKGDFITYDTLNNNFHDLFLSLSENILLKRIIMPLKRRLYDFPRRSYAYEWESIHLKEHERLISFIKQGNKTAAAGIFSEEHWNYSVHQPYLNFYYTSENSVE